MREIQNRQGYDSDVAQSASPEATISLKDPIDDVPDPVLFELVSSFTGANLYPLYPVVSAREMHLIIAEDALSKNDLSTYTEHINAIRALDDLTPYAGQIDAVELLVHTRRVNLFLQGRRIADHYRFNKPSKYWTVNSDATTGPGSLFPITISEIQANPNIN